MKDLIESKYQLAGKSKEDGYARFGVTRGRMKEGVVAEGNLGVVSLRYPYWALAAESLGLHLKWILVGDRRWVGRVRKRWPMARVECSLDIKLITMITESPVGTVAFDVGPPKSHLTFWSNPDLKMVIWSNGSARPIKGWSLDVLTGAHAAFGGVTAGVWGAYVATKGLGRKFIIPPQQAVSPGDVHQVLSPLEHGALAKAPVRDYTKTPVPELVDPNHLLDLRLIRCVYHKSGWGRRKMTPTEVLQVWDLPKESLSVWTQQEMSDVVTRGELIKTVPLKMRHTWGRWIREWRLESLSQSSAKKRATADSSAALLDSDSRTLNGKRLKIEMEPVLVNAATSLEEEIDRALETSHTKDLKAVKADDAEVPKFLWNDRVELLLRSTEKDELLQITKGSMLLPTAMPNIIPRIQQNWVDALEVLREKFFHRIWVRRLVRSFWTWVRSKSSSMCYELESVIVAADAISRAKGCTWWEWVDGSSLFFWRWPEDYQRVARDGLLPWLKAGHSDWKHKQAPPKDSTEAEKVRQKLQNIRKKRYVAPGKVTSFMSFFAVPKADDIRLVYDGTKCGLNEYLWAPWFPLPTVNSMLRSVLPGFWMGDNDIGEHFLNFRLHATLQERCGLDLTEFFPDEITESMRKEIHERWTRAAMGLTSSPYQAVQATMWADQIIQGNRHDINHPLHWSRVVLNLPGSAEYNPSMPWVYKIKADGTLAADYHVYVDDLRGTGPTEEATWQVSRLISAKLTFLGIQDAMRKRRWPSQKPGAWAGSVVQTTKNEVLVTVSQEKWDKCKRQINWIDEHSKHPGGIPFKELESIRGFLIYVTRTYPTMVPYLKGIHQTLDSWRVGRSDDGWKYKQTRDLEVDRLQNKYVQTYDDHPEFVKPAPLLEEHVSALKVLFDSDLPHVRRARPLNNFMASYGFGDASGMGFGVSVSFGQRLVYSYGIWSEEITNERSSNFRELGNLVEFWERAVSFGEMKNTELFLFTDNTTAEAAFYRGTAGSKLLFMLVMRLRKLEMRGDFQLHVVHIAGTRMIEQGVDGLSRGDLDSGVMIGKRMLEYVPLHQTVTSRQPRINVWVESWLPGDRTKLFWMSPEDWFDKAFSLKDGSTMVWCPAPAAADVAVEQMAKSQLKRPCNTHIVIVPRILTSKWRKGLSKAADIIVELPFLTHYWEKSFHEPLILAIALPLCEHSPWKLRGTCFTDRVESSLQKVRTSGKGDVRSILRKFLLEAGALGTMPVGILSEMFRPARR